MFDFLDRVQGPPEADKITSFCTNPGRVEKWIESIVKIGGFFKALDEFREQ